jgi:hypothetical protein
MSDAPTNPTGPAPLDAGSAGALSEKAVQDVVGRFRDAYDARNVDAVVDLFAEHGDWTLGPGTFTGRAAIRRVLEWDVRLSPTTSSRHSGIGTVVHGNVAVYEQAIEQSFEGIRCTFPVLTVLELNEAGKIDHARSYYDKLSILQQVANEYPGVKGWFLRKIVNLLVDQGEKGLERS